MSVLRIVPNIAGDPQAAAAFWRDALGLEIVLDQGWIVTFAAPAVEAAPQVSVATEGGSGAPVPDLSVEVDDLDAVFARVVAGGFLAEYGPATEPWGVRRFFVREPSGKLVNVLAHA